MDISGLYGRLLSSKGVSTDSRTIAPGQIFFALKGDNFDGSRYTSQVLEKGASCAVVASDSEAAAIQDSRIITVPDTLKTLQNLAAYHREQLRDPSGRRLRVLALTGTNGKTTTKELITTALAAGLKVSATKGNLNNDIGVPLSVLAIPQGMDIAVIEMGASHPDDLVPLLAVARPDFGIITNVGKAHLLGFGSYEGVKKAKGRLYDYIASVGGSVFVNGDDSVLVGMAAERGLKTIRYGLQLQGCKVLAPSAQEPFLRLDTGGRIINTRLVGSYNAPNVLAALCVSTYFGVPFEAAADALEAYVPVNNRSQMQKTQRNTLIVDAYNANPSSMKVALDSLGTFQGRKAALLGSMGELGEDSQREHRAIVRRLLDEPLDEICLVGEEFRRALETEGPAPQIRWYPDSEALAADCARISGATVLVKGSRSMQMEKCLPAL